MAPAKAKKPAVASDLLELVASGLAAIIGDEVAKKANLDNAKADLDNATARGIRGLVEQFEQLRGLNATIGEADEKRFLTVFEDGIRARGANDATAKARKSDVRTMLLQRHNLARTLDLVDELKAEVAASDLERKPAVNVRAVTLKVLRGLKQREADAAKGKKGVLLSTPEEEVAAIREGIFSPAEANPRDELLGLLTKIEEHMLVQVAAGDTWVPHPDVSGAVATVRKIVMAGDDALRDVEVDAIAAAPAGDDAVADAIDGLFDAAVDEGHIEATLADGDAGLLDGFVEDTFVTGPDAGSDVDLEEFTKGLL